MICKWAQCRLVIKVRKEISKIICITIVYHVSQVNEFPLRRIDKKPNDEKQGVDDDQADDHGKEMNVLHHLDKTDNAPTFDTSKLSDILRRKQFDTDTFIKIWSWNWHTTQKVNITILMTIAS